MIDYLAALQRESARFGEMLTHGDLSVLVPSCPDWTMADLAWHLTEVQQFWASIAGELLTDPDGVDKVERPAADADLPALFAHESAGLLTAVTDRSPADTCWSWDPAGGTVAWVRRRQAHEALIHRIDAELGAGAGHAPIDAGLAADGVDEILRSMLSGVPEWGTFTPDGLTVCFTANDTGGTWHGALGRFTGTSPNTGTTYDLAAMEMLDTAPADITGTIAGTAANLDLWLWGRGDIATLTVSGDETLPTRIREMAADSTQ